MMVHRNDERQPEVAAGAAFFIRHKSRIPDLHFWIGLAAVIVLGVPVVMLDAYLKGML
jgi:hypothetical protein